MPVIAPLHNGSAIQLFQLKGFLTVISKTIGLNKAGNQVRKVRIFKEGKLSLSVNSVKFSINVKWYQTIICAVQKKHELRIL